MCPDRTDIMYVSCHVLTLYLKHYLRGTRLSTVFFHRKLIFYPMVHRQIFKRFIERILLVNYCYKYFNSILMNEVFSINMCMEAIMNHVQIDNMYLSFKPYFKFSLGLFASLLRMACSLRNCTNHQPLLIFEMDFETG